MTQGAVTSATSDQPYGFKTYRKPGVWGYIHGYDELYTGAGAFTVSDLATTQSYQGGTIVAVPRLRVTCAFDDPHNSLARIAKGGFVSECILTIGKNRWEPASVLAAEGSHSSFGNSLFDTLLKRLTGFAPQSVEEESNASIIVLPRRRPTLFSSVLSIRPAELPRRKVSYIGDAEDVGDD